MQMTVDKDWIVAEMSQLFDGSAIRRVIVSRLEPTPRYPQDRVTRCPFLVLIRDGSVRMPVAVSGGERMERLTAGDGVYFPAGALAYLEQYEAFRYFRVTLDVDHSFLAVADQPGALGDPGRGYVLRGYADPRVAGPPVMRLLSELESLRGELAERKAALLFEMVLAELLEQVVASRETGKAEHSWSMVQAYLREHYVEPITRQDAASALGMSAGHISLLFRRFGNGKTFLDGLRELRMADARRLLAGTRLSVSAIAERCGYRSYRYFAYDFKNLNDCTPMQWRNS